MPKKKGNRSRPNGGGVALAQGRAFEGGGNDEFVLERTEYLRDVISTSATALDVVSIPMNPAQAAAAPSGSLVASAFEEYRLEACEIHFNSGSAATAAGKVFMKLDLDPTDAPPASKAELLTGPEHLRVSDNVYRNIVMRVPQSVIRSIGKKFCRPGNVPANSDQKLYDWATLHFGNLGATAANLGDLIIKYRYVLKYAELSYADQANAVSCHVESGGYVFDTLVYGNAPIVTGGLAVTAFGDDLTFNRLGQYLVALRLIGTGASTTTFGGTATSTEESSCTNADSTTLDVVLTVDVTELGQTLTIDASAWTSVTSSIVRVGLYAFALS